MKLLAEIRNRFSSALRELLADDPGELLAMIRPAQDARFGDYQANCAMPLGKRLGKAPREVATEIVAEVKLDDICDPLEIAGPGFINLKLQDSWLEEQLNLALQDNRLGITTVDTPHTIVIDYSSPNVAKPMHVGHIRSTVIGDALSRTLRFLGHTVISDNHLGDWGTQFGMIIYGYKNFVDQESYRETPVAELTRLYKLVNQLIEYHAAKSNLEQLTAQATAADQALTAHREQPEPEEKSARKQAKATGRKLAERQRAAAEALQSAQGKVAAVEQDSQLVALADAHPSIGTAVLEETAALHHGDQENRRLWDEFLPACRADIQRVYDRLDVEFDYEYGESFYQERLAGVVTAFEDLGLARQSEGADCIFLDGFETPMLIRKRDGAFLYATTDLATIQFRLEEWQPDAILYVVDHRQSEHFEKLFAAARLWGCPELELTHISFGTVLGSDGKPYKTRSGEAAGLEGLLDRAVDKALEIVVQNDESKESGAELSGEERSAIADAVGHGAIKYADLSHNRTSDYEFSYDKMLALTGNTATYLQYSYARVNGIFGKSDVSAEKIRAADAPLRLENAEERKLGLALLRFEDALDEMLTDYRPNILTAYLFDLTKTFFSFYEQHQVLKAEHEAQRTSRLALCDLTGRTIRKGLELLGIRVVDRM